MSLGIWSVELWFPGWGLVIVLYLKGINLMLTFLAIIPLYEDVESATLYLLSNFHFGVISGAMLTKRIFFLLSMPAKYGTAFDYGLFFEFGSRVPNNVK